MPTRPRRRLVRIGTLNLHVDTVRRHPEAVEAYLVDLLEAQVLPIVLGLQEAGSADAILNRIDRIPGVTVYRGDGSPGAASTPIVVKGLPVLEVATSPLTPRTPVGPEGAGPRVLKAKHANRVTLDAYGRLLTVANAHGIASAHLSRRRRLAARLFTVLAMLRIRGLLVVVGDLNQRPGSRLTAPLRAAGLRSAQLALGPLRTHRVGSPDDVLARWAPWRLRLLDLVDYDAPGDHDLLIATYGIRPRRRAR